MARTRVRQAAETEVWAEEEPGCSNDNIHLMRLHNLKLDSILRFYYDTDAVVCNILRDEYGGVGRQSQRLPHISRQENTRLAHSRYVRLIVVIRTEQFTNGCARAGVVQHLNTPCGRPQSVNSNSHVIHAAAKSFPLMLRAVPA